MKIGYFADGPWSHSALERIRRRGVAQVAFICVRANSTDEVLPRLAAEMGVPCFKHPDVNSQEFLATIGPFACDIHVSMSFDQIFRRPMLEDAPGGVINCHAGKLPFYRGRNILNWALINGEKEFGITVHHVDAGIDTGDIILQRVYPIAEDDTYATLLERSFTGCAEALDEALALLAKGEAPRIRQNSIHPVGSYCGRRGEGDERIDWRQTSQDLHNFIRAVCHPGPRARTTYEGLPVSINRARLVPEAPKYKGIPGQIIGKVPDGWLVKTEDSFLEIYEVETAGKLRVGGRFA